MVEQVGGVDPLAERLEASPELEALFFEAVQAGACTGVGDKRRLLGRVVSAAVLDDAELEPGQPLVQALRELDAPHLRGLEAVRRAIDASGSSPGHDRCVVTTVAEVVMSLPAPVRAALVAAGALWVGSGALRGSPEITDLGQESLDDSRAAGATRR